MASNYIVKIFDFVGLISLTIKRLFNVAVTLKFCKKYRYITYLLL